MRLIQKIEGKIKRKTSIFNKIKTDNTVIARSCLLDLAGIEEKEKEKIKINRKQKRNDLQQYDQFQQTVNTNKVDH